MAGLAVLTRTDLLLPLLAGLPLVGDHLGHRAGDLVPRLPTPSVAHGADPSSLRGRRLVGVHGHRAVLVVRRHLRRARRSASSTPTSCASRTGMTSGTRARDRPGGDRHRRDPRAAGRRLGRHGARGRARRVAGVRGAGRRSASGSAPSSSRRRTRRAIRELGRRAPTSSCRAHSCALDHPAHRGRARGGHTGAQRDRSRGGARPCADRRGHRHERQDDGDVADRGDARRLAGQLRSRPATSGVRSSTRSATTSTSSSPRCRRSSWPSRRRCGRASPSCSRSHPIISIGTGHSIATRDSKARIFARQSGDDLVVFDADDPTASRDHHERSGTPCRRVAAARCDAVATAWSATSSCTPTGALLAPLSIMRRALAARPHERARPRRRPRSQVGATRGRCAPRCATYATMPHRVALVGEASGVRWYDDSKATNPDATLRALDVVRFGRAPRRRPQQGSRSRRPRAQPHPDCAASSRSARHAREVIAAFAGPRRRSSKSRTCTTPCAPRTSSRTRATSCCCRPRARRSTRTRATPRVATTSRRRSGRCSTRSVLPMTAVSPRFPLHRLRGEHNPLARLNGLVATKLERAPPACRARRPTWCSARPSPCSTSSVS